MKTKLFVFATVLAIVAALFVPGVFADDNNTDDSKSYYPKPIYYVTLSNRFPMTNEFAPIGFVCTIQSKTAPEVDLKTAKLTMKDADIMFVDTKKSEDRITVIQGKINLVINLLVNWDTVVVIEDTDMNDIYSAQYSTVYGLDKPRFSNFPVGNTGATAGITTGATFKILVPRHKI